MQAGNKSIKISARIYTKDKIIDENSPIFEESSRVIFEEKIARKFEHKTNKKSIVKINRREILFPFISSRVFLR